MMRRLLFALGRAARPGFLLGAGTYVGYAFVWLLRDPRDPASAPSWQQAVALDIDLSATQLARRNGEILGFESRLVFECADAVSWPYGETPIDLLFLDVDHPEMGKADYSRVLGAAAPALEKGALVLAHDPCVSRFERDFARYHGLVRDLGLRGPWILPVDECGLSLAVAR